MNSVVLETHRSLPPSSAVALAFRNSQAGSDLLPPGKELLDQRSIRQGARSCHRANPDWNKLADSSAAADSFAATVLVERQGCSARQGVQAVQTQIVIGNTVYLHNDSAEDTARSNFAELAHRDCTESGPSQRARHIVVVATERIAADMAAVADTVVEPCPVRDNCPLDSEDRIAVPVTIRLTLAIPQRLVGRREWVARADSQPHCLRCTLAVARRYSAQEWPVPETEFARSAAERPRWGSH